MFLMCRLGPWRPVVADRMDALTPSGAFFLYLVLAVVSIVFVGGMVPFSWEGGRDTHGEELFQVAELIKEGDGKSSYD